MNKDDWIGLGVTLIGVIVVLGIGYIVIQQQVIQVREYCESLITNGTITNMSECNITVEGMAKINGDNLSIVR
jgi:hypothetical protein